MEVVLSSASNNILNSIHFRVSLGTSESGCHSHSVPCTEHHHTKWQNWHYLSEVASHPQQVWFKEFLHSIPFPRLFGNERKKTSITSRTINVATGRAIKRVRQDPLSIDWPSSTIRQQLASQPEVTSDRISLTQEIPPPSLITNRFPSILHHIVCQIVHDQLPCLIDKVVVSNVHASHRFDKSSRSVGV